MRHSPSRLVCSRQRSVLREASRRLFRCTPSIFIRRCKDFRSPTLAALDEFLAALESKHADLLYLHDEDLRELVKQGSYKAPARQRKGERDSEELHQGPGDAAGSSRRDQAPMKQKSIVLVTVDCLRADHVGFMGYERPTTPFLDSLAGESFVVPAAIVAGAPTYYSFPAIMASRYPLALGRDVLGLGPDEPTLASVLKQAGYSTASFGAANPYISARFGYEHGFDTFRDFLEDEPAPLPEEKANAANGNGWASRLNQRLQKIRPALGPLRWVYDELYFGYCQRMTPVADSLDALRRFPAADVIVDHACIWLASIGDAPFFLWLHLMDPHSPYYPKDAALTLMGQRPVTPYRARYLNSYWNRSDLGPRRFARHRDEVVALYDAGIRWVDVQMSRLVEDAA